MSIKWKNSLLWRNRSTKSGYYNINTLLIRYHTRTAYSTRTRNHTLWTTSPGYEYSWVQVFLGTSTPGYKYSWVRELLDTSTPGYEYSWVRVLLGTSTPGYEYSCTQQEYIHRYNLIFLKRKHSKNTSIDTI